MQCACTCCDSLQPSGGVTRVGSHWPRNRAICMAAHDLGRLNVRTVVAWLVALEGRQGQWRASGLT